MAFVAYTASERPDLWERGIPSGEVWPEYNMHGDILNRWWGHLDEELADFQFVLYDEAEDVAAERHTGPLWWDGKERDAARRDRHRDRADLPARFSTSGPDPSRDPLLPPIMRARHP